MSKKLHDLITATGLPEDSPTHAALYREIRTDLRPNRNVPDEVLRNFIKHNETNFRYWSQQQTRALHDYEVAIRQIARTEQELQEYRGELSLREMNGESVPMVQRAGNVAEVSFEDTTLRVVGEKANWAPTITEEEI